MIRQQLAWLKRFKSTSSSWNNISTPSAFPTKSSASPSHSSFPFSVSKVGEEMVDNALDIVDGGSLDAEAAVTVIKSSTAAQAPQQQEQHVIPANGQILPAFATSSVPLSMLNRRVRIYKPTQPITQSSPSTSYSAGNAWVIDFDVQEKWTNPMMGYVSSGDPVQALNIKFMEKQEAILFAEKQGWDYIVQEDQSPVFKQKSYASNYKYQQPGKKIRLVPTK